MISGDHWRFASLGWARHRHRHRRGLAAGLALACWVALAACQAPQPDTAARPGASALPSSPAAATAPALIAATPQRWTPPALSSELYESSPTFSADGREVYFMRSQRDFTGWRLLYSRCQAGGWSAPRAPSFAAARAGLDADPHLAPDGQRLYFVSARHDPRGEDLDIYQVQRRGQGWGRPQRLPAPVNSPAAELLPRAQADGRLLFGSARAGGLGQGDLYQAEPLAGGGWQVRRLDPPLSSPANEYEADLAADGLSLVAVIDRGERSHLYRFQRQRDGQWRQTGRLPARSEVFQVGPLLSPRGDRLLFAQADGARSGEWFLLDLAPDPDRSWPPACPGR